LISHYNVLRLLYKVSRFLIIVLIIILFSRGIYLNLALEYKDGLCGVKVTQVITDRYKVKKGAVLLWENESLKLLVTAFQIAGREGGIQYFSCG